MDIAFAFDSAYAPYVPAAIESLLANHRAAEISLWLVATRDVTPETRRRLAWQVGDRGSVEFLDPGRELDGLPVSDVPESYYVSTAAYLRIMLPRLLPSHVSRVLYLDTDTLCLGHLRELFNTDLQGNIAAAARDAYVHDMSAMNGLPGLARYEGLRPQDPYFDSGVLLIDIPKWLDDGIEERCFDYIWRHASETRFSDQDALNYALHGKWLIVSNKWNYILGPRLESPIGYHLAEARIIQQIGPDKLWDADFPSSERKELYEAYAHKARMAAEAGGKNVGTP